MANRVDLDANGRFALEWVEHRSCRAGIPMAELRHRKPLNERLPVRSQLLAVS